MAHNVEYLLANPSGWINTGVSFLSLGGRGVLFAHTHEVGRVARSSACRSLQGRYSCEDGRRKQPINRDALRRFYFSNDCILHISFLIKILRPKPRAF